MSETSLQLDSVVSAENERLKKFKAELSAQLQLCKKIVEEDLNTNSLGIEHIRHVDDFIKNFRTMRTSIILAEICNTVPEIKENDRSTLQILQTRRDINEKLDQLVHHVDDLIEQLKRKQTLLSSYKGVHGAPKLSRRRYCSDSTFRYPAYDCKQFPGPSGCTFWNCRTDGNVIDDGKTAFMILEDAK